MSEVRTTMTPPVYLSFPPKPPAPAEECDLCAALVKQRTEAEGKGDFSTAVDCNIELRNHPHRRAIDRKSV
ncbi:hypothetical protein [Streptomyces nigrescens]